MKGIIIYKGKYGATRQYAYWLAASLSLPVINADEATPAQLADYELIILGSAVYIGKLAIGKWLEQNLKLLADKKLLLFAVCGMTVDSKDEQQKVIENNLEPAIRQATEVFFLPGRCVVAKLKWKDRLILKMGAWMVKDPVKRAVISQGFDRVDQKKLDELISQSMKYLKPELELVV